MDAIVLAGTREGYVPVGEDRGNKCLLEVGGRPLVSHVLAAIKSSPLVGNIYLVGHVAELSDTLDEDMLEGVFTVEQGSNLVENVTIGYTAKLKENTDPYVIILSGDMPFLTSTEVERFISRSGYRNFGCVVGFSSKSSLVPFEAYSIKLGCIYFRQFTGRIANMLIADPSSATNLEYLRKLYKLRYQKRFKNYVKLVQMLLESDLDKFALMKLSFLAQLGLRLDNWGLRGLARLVGRFSDVGVFERNITRIFGTRFHAFCMEDSFGALDVDSVNELEVYRRNFSRFSSYVKERVGELIKGQ